MSIHDDVANTELVLLKGDEHDGKIYISSSNQVTIRLKTSPADTAQGFSIAFDSVDVLGKQLSLSAAHLH